MVSTTTKHPSVRRAAVDTSLQKSMCPGESIKFIKYPLSNLSSIGISFGSYEQPPKHKQIYFLQGQPHYNICLKSTDVFFCWLLRLKQHSGSNLEHSKSIQNVRVTEVCMNSTNQISGLGTVRKQCTSTLSPTSPLLELKASHHVLDVIHSLLVLVHRWGKRSKAPRRTYSCAGGVSGEI